MKRILSSLWIAGLVCPASCAASQDAAIAPGDASRQIVTVDRDNVRISRSCTVRIASDRIIDADGDGVVQIDGDNIEVDFAGGRLHGAEADANPDTYAGTGIRITGRNVVLRGARVSGFKCGIHAIDADGLTIEDCEVSDNFRQRLGSTPEREDGADWLWPHANDEHEWLTNYGAGMYVERSDDVTIRRIRARNVQNGIIIDRVNDSRIYDNDCSFLSGWGLAMWRSSGNTISRNAFDFCIRGYSHGVYNRGQDSAGILMFEQCCDNIIVENSCTHGGDGFFGFAGKEALGQVNPREDIEWYKKRGNADNHLHASDFSYAAAHGIEMTFSHGNKFSYNRIVGNAICGVWGGYSNVTRITHNLFEDNGDMAYGLERGGINIEHGCGSQIVRNTFLNNACGIHIWWDNDEDLLKTPWAQTNPTGAHRNAIISNTFDGDETAVHLRQTGMTLMMACTMNDVGVELDADDKSRESLTLADTPATLRDQYPTAIGDTRPVGARVHLRGREHIIMTKWGPYDWERPMLDRVKTLAEEHVYRVLGPDEAIKVQDITHTGEVDIAVDNDSELHVRAADANAVTPYSITVTLAEHPLTAAGVLIGATWDVQVFANTVLPNVHPDHGRLEPQQLSARYDAWLDEAKHHAIHATTPALNLAYAGAGPSQLDLSDDITAANLPTDHFSTIAETTLRFPGGSWRIRTRSDDGIRVWMDDVLVIDDWTWHPPKEHVYEFEIDQPRDVRLRVEHFELDGHAVLTLDIEPD